MDKLAKEIAIEKEYITETLSTLRKALDRPEKSDIELTAIGACLHHCYNGIENILKRVLKFQKITIHDSPSSHKDLLDIALQQGLISDEVSENLDSYRGFRHFFVHGYGAMLRIYRVDAALNRCTQRISWWRVLMVIPPVCMHQAVAEEGF